MEITKCIDFFLSESYESTLTDSHKMFRMSSRNRYPVPSFIGDGLPTFLKKWKKIATIGTTNEEQKWLVQPIVRDIRTWKLEPIKKHQCPFIIILSGPFFSNNIAPFSFQSGCYFSIWRLSKCVRRQEVQSPRWVLDCGLGLDRAHLVAAGAHCVTVRTFTDKGTQTYKQLNLWAEEQNGRSTTAFHIFQFR